MKLKITMELDNDAFSVAGWHNEAARILGELSTAIGEHPLSAGEFIGVYDLNGNEVGEAKVTR